jgi:hypothetical protein
VVWHYVGSQISLLRVNVGGWRARCDICRPLWLHIVRDRHASNSSTMYTISAETADEDLPKQWELIISRLNEITGWNLNAKTTASIDSVVLRIVPPKDDDSGEKHAKAKKVWKTTMMCVDKLGIFVQRFGSIVVRISLELFFKAQSMRLTSRRRRPLRWPLAPQGNASTRSIL